MRIKYAAVSDRGKVRRENQDRIYMSHLSFDSHSYIEASGFLDGDTVTLAVFDGMGGEMCGGQAAEIAAWTVRERDLTDLKKLCQTMNENICRYMKQNKIQSMGSTAAMVQIKNHTAYCCNLGDSRAYYVSDGEIQQISVDHTVTFGKKRVLTQYLGIPETEVVIEPSIRKVALKKKDKLLLCSDGLTDMVPREEIAEIVNQYQTEDTATALFEAAMAHGGKDNISIIICEVA